MGSTDATGSESATRPIFVVGCPRSGTTMMRAILNAHPHISCGPETGFLLGLNRWERRHPDTPARFGSSREEFHRQARALLDDLHESLAAVEGKQRWADKTPTHAIILDFIDALYPTCQVIHMVRDPVDVIDSERRKHGLQRARRTSADWPRHVAAARHFGQTHPPDRYLEIRYEHLVQDPEKVLRDMFAWLGEPWSSEVLEFRTHRPPDETSEDVTARPGYRGDRAPGVFSSSVGSGHRHLSSMLIALPIRWSGGLMHELGYHWWSGADR
jgi:Sulfotransferase family